MNNIRYSNIDNLQEYIEQMQYAEKIEDLKKIEQIQEVQNKEEKQKDAARNGSGPSARRQSSAPVRWAKRSFADIYHRDRVFEVTSISAEVTTRGAIYVKA